jgi:hypothetical protein
MEALKEILSWLSDGGHAITAIVLLGIFFGGTVSIINALRGKSDDEGGGDSEY